MKRDDNDLLREVDARIYGEEHPLRNQVIATIILIAGIVAAVLLAARIIP